MPSIKTKAKTSKLTSTDGAVTLEIVRKSWDYERDELTTVFKVSVRGLASSQEVAVRYAISELLKKQAKQDETVNAWLIQDAIDRKAIPAGTVA